MYHTIEFAVDLTVDLEISPKHRMERLRVRRGMRMPAHVKPHVIESSTGPVEAADLFFADGTTARSVPFGLFRFVD